MRTNYILVDFENVQPASLQKIPKDFPVKLIVFLGENQTKIPFDFASALQKLGTRAEYIKISGQGKNALDFHIAFWVGQLSEQERDAYFNIVSKDKGFDPLMTYLKSLKILARRVNCLSEISIFKNQNLSHSDKISAMVNFLKSRGNARPRKRKTLRNAIASYFAHTMNEEELDHIIQTLLSKNYICITDESITYTLPEDEPKCSVDINHDL